MKNCYPVIITQANSTVVKLLLLLFLLMTTGSQAFAKDAAEQAFLDSVYKKWSHIDHKTQTAESASDTYLLGPDDLLSVFIPDLFATDLSSVSQLAPRAPRQAILSETAHDYKVGLSGDLTLPILGTFNVNKMSLSNVKGMIAEMASYYLTDPSVMVILKGHRAYNVYLIGEVKRPGTYQIPPTTENITYNFNGGDNYVNKENQNFAPSLTSALKGAGGINQYADVQHITIDNSLTGKHIEVDLTKLLSNGDSSQDPHIDPEDVIRVSKSADSILLNNDVALSNLAPSQYYVRMVGYVNKSFTSGQIQLTPDHMTLLDAMGLVSFSSDISTKRAIILRTTPGVEGFQRFDVNPYKKPFALEPGDTIVFTDVHAMARFKDFAQLFTQFMLPATVLLKN